MVVVPLAVRLHTSVHKIFIIGDDGLLIDVLKVYDASPYLKEPHEPVISLLGILPLAILPDGRTVSIDEDGYIWKKNGNN